MIAVEYNYLGCQFIGFEVSLDFDTLDEKAVKIVENSGQLNVVALQPIVYRRGGQPRS